MNVQDICSKLKWILSVDWELIYTLLGMLISALGIFICKKFFRTILRMLLKLRRNKDVCTVSYPTHQCRVLNRKRDMVIDKEARQCFALIDLLNDAGIKVDISKSVEESENDEIHIGGPASNRHTNRYFCSYIRNIKWAATKSHIEQYKEDKNLREFNYDYCTVADSKEGFLIDGQLYEYEKDQVGWAFLVRFRTADDVAPKTVHLLFGCGTNGTIGAVNYFLKKYPSIWFKNLFKKDYIGVFKVDRDGNKIGDINWLSAESFIRK